MKVSEAFPSKYLSANDIPEDNIRLVMDRVETTELENKQKMVLFFQRAKKGMILNKTNASNIAAAYGDDTDDWVGKELILFTTWVDYQGKSVEAIRVRAPAAKDNAKLAQASSSAPVAPRRSGADMDDDIPFAPEMRG